MASERIVSGVALSVSVTVSESWGEGAMLHAAKREGFAILRHRVSDVRRDLEIDPNSIRVERPAMRPNARYFVVYGTVRVAPCAVCGDPVGKGTGSLGHRPGGAQLRAHRDCERFDLERVAAGFPDAKDPNELRARLRAEGRAQ